MAQRVEVRFVGVTTQLKQGVDRGIAQLRRLSNFAKKHENSIKKARMQAGVALGAQILLVRNLIQAYEKQEQADAMLLQSMKTRGIYTDEAYEKTKRFANEMQRLTKYGNEEVEMAQSLLIAVGQLSDEGLEAATRATLDLAAAKAMDLKAAADLVSKSIGSTTNALGRYGITIQEGVVEPTERAKLITVEIAKMFGGQAMAAANTYTGQLKQMGNVIGDLKEDLGKAFLPILLDLTRDLREALPVVRAWVKAHAEMIGVLMGGGMFGAGLLVALSQFALVFSNPATGWIAGIGFAALAIGMLVVKLRLLSSAFTEIPRSVKGIDKAISGANSQLVELQDQLDQMSSKDASLMDFVLGKPSRLNELSKIEKMKKDIAKLIVYIAELNEARASLITDEAKFTQPAEIGGEPTPIIPGLPTEEDVLVAEDLFARLTTIQEEYYDKLEKMGKDELKRINDVEKAKAAAQLSKAIDITKSIAYIYDDAFSSIFQMRLRFDKAMVLSLARSLASMFSMLIDAAIDEVMLAKIVWTAKLLMKGAFDWTALAQIAGVYAAAGAAKSAINALAGSAAGKLGGGRYKYGGVLPADGWYYGEKGEKVSNPNEPLESAANTGDIPPIQWNQIGPIRDRAMIDEALAAFRDELVYGSIGRRVATI